MSQINGFTSETSNALPLHVMTREQYTGWRAQQSDALGAWLDAQRFNSLSHML